MENHWKPQVDATDTYQIYNRPENLDIARGQYTRATIHKPQPATNTLNLTQVTKHL